jgi:hypothetical protein
MGQVGGSTPPLATTNPQVKALAREFRRRYGPARARIPKWCSSSCRHRAWELTRAADSGRAAVQVVDRVVEVDRPVTVVQEVPVTTFPKGASWRAALAELAAELDTAWVSHALLNSSWSVQSAWPVSASN